VSVNRNQQAYDRGTSLYSPDGRIYQVEYAREAVKRGAPSVGVRAADGVVLAARTRTDRKLMETESVEKLHKLDDHVAAASAGHVADARQLVDIARQRAQVERLRYGEPVGVETLAKEITDEIQESTQFGGTRPFGASLLVGGMDGDHPRLFETDPSGTPHEWRAVAIGGGQADIIEFLEESYDEADIESAVVLALRSLILEDDDIAAASLSVATIDAAEGYRRLGDDEVATHLETARTANRETEDAADDADGDGTED
jgi:proteasome alpha subunit